MATMCRTRTRTRTYPWKLSFRYGVFLVRKTSIDKHPHIRQGHLRMKPFSTTIKILPTTVHTWKDQNTARSQWCISMSIYKVLQPTLDRSTKQHPPPPPSAFSSLDSSITFLLLHEQREKVFFFKWYPLSSSFSFHLPTWPYGQSEDIGESQNRWVLMCVYK